jgi:L,D-transpeptidase catalytic domain
VKIVPGFSRAVHVVIKVSLQSLMVYAKEGDKPLLVAATATGTLTNPTPPGRFRVTLKIENKRSNSYGSWVTEDTIVPDKSSRPGAPRLLLHWSSHALLG